MILAGKALLAGATILAGAGTLAGGTILAGVALLAGGSQPLTSSRPDPIRQQIAEGIYLFRTAPYGEVGLDGNSIAIIGTDGVLVFDSRAGDCLQQARPRAAAAGVSFAARKRIAKAAAATAPPANLPQLKQALADGRFFLEQKNGVHHTLPNQTYTDKLTLKIGDREVQVLHHDRAVTPGDSFLFLPKERIVITGDLLGW